ncbi:Rho GTPase activation protein [Phycomyces blakesleeanus]|uniref:Rho GTPase activation protein n=1 Tax=Phycomyces blakesleeanus TaxID=4837 RepID=A0ABR3B2F5_PHYBL
MSCGTAKGHLFLKRRSCGNSAPVWARLYFFIQKDTGLLMQQPLKEDAFSVINLKYTTVRPAENEKRDYVIQLTSISKDIELLLQPETLMEYTSWFGALSSWSAGNLTAPLEYNSAKPALKARCSATPSPRGSSNNGRLFLTKRPSFSAASIMMENTLFKSSESFNSIGNSSISGSNSINTIYTQAKSFQDPPSSYDTGNVPRVIRSTPIFMREPCSSKNSGSSSNNNPKTGGWCELQAVLISDGVLQIKSKDILGEETFSQRHHHSIHLGFIQRHQIYILSETVYTRSNCFAIFISPLEMIHISVSTPQERDQWIVLLKFFCVPDIVCSTRPSTDTLGSASASAIAMSSYTHPAEAFSHRYGRTLSISIQEGKNIHMNSKGLECSELYCDLLVDNEKRGVTGKLKKTPTPFWRENFVFTDVPIIRQGITVNIMSRNSKNERETRIGSIFIPSDQIGICNTNEVWYDIRKQSRHRTFASLASLGYAQSYASAGELKVGTRLDEQIVLPFCQYNELVEFLKEFHNDSVYEIARKNSDLEGVTTTLVRIYEGLGLSVPWIKSLIDYEVSTMSSDDANILFRGNSLLTKVIDVYMKMVGKSYLEEAIGSIILSICSSRVCIEVDISKIDKKEDITQNCEKLARYVQLLWTSIEATKLKCPEELRQIFSHLQSVIIKKFQLDTNPDSPKQAARYTCVSGFLFLRLICPAIVSPKLFGIVKDYPDLKTSRTLTLLAKCLMNLANLVDPSSKEPWMKHLNQFSQNNTRGFMDFINFISKAQPASNRPSLPPSWDNILHDLPDQLQLEKPVYMTLQDMSMPPYYVNLPLELSQFSTSLINGSHHYATIQHGKSLKQLLQICQGIASVQQEIHISSKTASSFQSRSSVGDNVSGPECVVNWGIPSSPSSASMNDINTYNAAARSPCHSIDYYRATE